MNIRHENPIARVPRGARARPRHLHDIRAEDPRVHRRRWFRHGYPAARSPASRARGRDLRAGSTRSGAHGELAAEPASHERGASLNSRVSSYREVGGRRRRAVRGDVVPCASVRSRKPQRYARHRPRRVSSDGGPPSRTDKRCIVPSSSPTATASASRPAFDADARRGSARADPGGGTQGPLAQVGARTQMTIRVVSRCFPLVRKARARAQRGSRDRVVAQARTARKRSAGERLDGRHYPRPAHAGTRAGAPVDKLRTTRLTSA